MGLSDVWVVVADEAEEVEVPGRQFSELQNEATRKSHLVSEVLVRDGP